MRIKERFEKLDFNTKEMLLDVLGNDIDLNTLESNKHFKKVEKQFKLQERKTIETMDSMCAESLDPETHLKWEQVKAVLYNTRKYLKR